MATSKSAHNIGILEYALHHLEKEAAEIQAKIDHIRGQLGHKVVSSPAPASSPAAAATSTGKKRVLSAAARKRIAAAQKKRWAEHRKAKTGKPASKSA
jgi:hypothetical protein